MKAKDFLAGLRDGKDSPDVFYLGQMAGRPQNKRFAARFDSIHTLHIPIKPPERATFLSNHRVARLSIDFRRHLHSRMFEAFSVLGFDDYSWYSNDDLEYLVATGRNEIQSLGVTIQQLESAAKVEDNKESVIKSTQNKRADVKESLAKFEGELRRRKETFSSSLHD